MHTSTCFDSFGYGDFDPERLGLSGLQCPVRDCPATPESIAYRTATMPWCRVHGLRLHSNTFVYWNGAERTDEAQLRNFMVRHDLVRSIALSKGMKAESHRLGSEMSEDALSWNVFVSLAAAGKLREVARFLTGRAPSAEPHLYLWGRQIDDERGRHVL